MNNNMADMFGKFSEMQSKVKEAKQELSKLEVEAEAGGGMVKVRASGDRKILDIQLDKDIIDTDDGEMVEGLVVAGVNKALDQDEEAGQERMQEADTDRITGLGIL